MADPWRAAGIAGAVLGVAGLWALATGEPILAAIALAAGAFTLAAGAWARDQ